MRLSQRIKTGRDKLARYLEFASRSTRSTRDGHSVTLVTARSLLNIAPRTAHTITKLHGTYSGLFVAHVHEMGRAHDSRRPNSARRWHARTRLLTTTFTCSSFFAGSTTQLSPRAESKVCIASRAA